MSHIQSYDPRSDKWTQGGEIPKARQRGSAGTVVYDDKIYNNEKTCNQLDLNIDESKNIIIEHEQKIEDFESRKKIILNENVGLEKKKETHRQNRIKKEKEVERKLNELKQIKMVQAKDIKLLEQKLKEINFSKSPAEANKTKVTNPTEGQKVPADLLEFLKEQIKRKEEDLECPVCLETSTIPIFMCQQQHIICQQCLHKVNIVSSISQLLSLAHKTTDNSISVTISIS